MSERNAKLLRRYVRFMGDRMPEFVNIPERLATPGSPTKRVRNPILEDYEVGLSNGSHRDRAWWARSIKAQIKADLPLQPQGSEK